MKKILALIFVSAMLSGCNFSMTQTDIIKNVKLVDTDPFDNCRSCSYGVFEKENGEQFKLPVSDERLERMVEGTVYDIEYEVKDFDYPSNEVVNVFITNNKQE